MSCVLKDMPRETRHDRRRGPKFAPEKAQLVREHLERVERVRKARKERCT